MVAREFISDSIPPIKPSDTITYALDWMYEFKLSQLPIVLDGKFQGIITENDLLDAVDPEAKISELRYTGWDSAYVNVNQHMYEVIKMMSALQLELLPVLDSEMNYMGLISLKDVVQHLGGHFAIQEAGGILVLEIPSNSYVLSEIGRIVESADAKVLSFYLNTHPDGGALEVTLKLNVEDLTRVVAAFERFKYKVVRTFHQFDRTGDYKQNVDALMFYLNM